MAQGKLMKLRLSFSLSVSNGQETFLRENHKGRDLCEARYKRVNAETIAGK